MNENPTTKYLEIEDSGYVWRVPLLVIAEERARYYAKRDPDTSFEEEVDYVMEDGFEGIDWYQNNMNFEDVAEHATLYTTPQPLKAPRAAHASCEIVESQP